MVLTRKYEIVQSESGQWRIHERAGKDRIVRYSAFGSREEAERYLAFFLNLTNIHLRD